MTAQQGSLQALVSEKSELTFLTIERRSVVYHLRVDFNLRRRLINFTSHDGGLSYLVNPLHVVTKLFQILDVSITDFTDNKISLPPLALAGLARLDDGRGAGGGGGVG